MAFSTEHSVSEAASPTNGPESTASLEDEYLAAEMEDIMRADLIDRALPQEHDEEFGDLILFDDNLDSFNHVRCIEYWIFLSPLDRLDDEQQIIPWYPIALYPSGFSHLRQLPNELLIKALRNMLIVSTRPDIRIAVAQALLRAGGSPRHLSALAIAIEDHLVWVRAARTQQAEIDKLEVADDDLYTSTVERRCVRWNEGHDIVHATGRPTPASLDIWRHNRRLLRLAKMLIKEAGLADAWLALNDEILEMQKVLKAIYEELQRPYMRPAPQEKFFLRLRHELVLVSRLCGGIQVHVPGIQQPIILWAVNMDVQAITPVTRLNPLPEDNDQMHPLRSIITIRKSIAENAFEQAQSSLFGQGNLRSALEGVLEEVHDTREPFWVRRLALQ